MRVLVAVSDLVMATGCGAASPSGAATAGSAQGRVDLAALCPQLHAVIDALVVSSPSAQQAFVAQIERISDAGTGPSQAAIAPLLAAGRALAEAGTGPGYFTAMRGIYPAQVSLDNACVKVGSPILHAGH